MLNVFVPGSNFQNWLATKLSIINVHADALALSPKWSVFWGLVFPIPTLPPSITVKTSVVPSSKFKISPVPS